MMAAWLTGENAARLAVANKGAQRRNDLPPMTIVSKADRCLLSPELLAVHKALLTAKIRISGRY
jgi:hypothetical protein